MNFRYEEDNQATKTTNKVREDSLSFEMKFDRKFVEKQYVSVNEEDMQSIITRDWKTSTQCAVQEKQGIQPVVQPIKEDILDEKTGAQGSISFQEPQNQLQRLLSQQFVSPVEQPQLNVDVICDNPIGIEENDDITHEDCVPPITSGEKLAEHR